MPVFISLIVMRCGSMDFYVSVDIAKLQPFLCPVKDFYRTWADSQRTSTDIALDNLDSGGKEP